jgi:hypothetical protein
LLAVIVPLIFALAVVKTPFKSTPKFSPKVIPQFNFVFPPISPTPPSGVIQILLV